MIGSTETYGLRIQPHDILLYSTEQMRHADLFQISFRESQNPDRLLQRGSPNPNASRSRASIMASKEGNGGARAVKSSGRRIWAGVDGKQVAALLANPEFPRGSGRQCFRLSAYIREQLPWAVDRMDRGRLSGSGETIDCRMDVRDTERAPRSEARGAGTS